MKARLQKHENNNNIGTVKHANKNKININSIGSEWTTDDSISENLSINADIASHFFKFRRLSKCLRFEVYEVYNSDSFSLFYYFG